MNESVSDMVGNPIDGYVMVGQTYSTCSLTTDKIHGRMDAWIIKVDSSGNKIWSETFGGSKEDGFYNVRELSKGGYVAIGSTASTDFDAKNNHGGLRDGFITKVSEDGILIWTKVYGGSKSELLYDIIETDDNGFIAVGVTQSTDGDIKTAIKGGGDAWIVRLDSNGNIIWQKTIGSYQPVGADNFKKICRTSDNYYIMCGMASAGDGDIPKFQGLGDVWVLKIDDSGNIIWNKTYGGSGAEVGQVVTPTKDGGCIVGAYSTSKDGDVSSNNGQEDIWVFKLTQQGSLEWQKNYGGTLKDWPASIIETLNGGYMVLGYTYSKDGDVKGHYGPTDRSDILLLKLDSIGDIEHSNYFGGTEGESAGAIIQGIDSTYTFCGTTHSINHDITIPYGFGDAWFVNVGKKPTSIFSQKVAADAFKVYPTVSKDYIYIESKNSNEEIIIKMSNISGQNIRINPMVNNNTHQINIQNLPAGSYFLRLTTIDNVYSYKFLKI